MTSIPLWSVLAAAFVVACLLRDAAMIRGAAALLLNWAILTASAAATGDQFNVPLNMSVDWVTILLGFAPATQLPQVLMALLFGIGMIFHADHLVKLWIGVPLEKLIVPYWYRFHYLAWSQAALMLVWESYGGGRLILCWLGDLRRLKPSYQSGYLFASRRKPDR